MSANERYTIRQFSFEECLNDLNETSPLQMSKKLLEYELYDQQDSLEVLNQIYEEFENKQDIVDELVNPIFFNIADGLIKHPKLGLNKTGLTATKFVSEIKDFDYNKPHKPTMRDMFQDKKTLDENSEKHVDDKGAYERKDMDNGRRTTIADEKFSGNRTAHSDLEITDNNGKKRLYRYQKDKAIQQKKEDGKTTTHLTQNTDHNVPLKHVFDDFGKSTVLSKDDLKKISNIDKNFDIISESLNKSKGDKTWNEYLKDNPNAVNEATKEKILARENEAIQALEKEANKTVANNFINDTKHINNITSEAGKQALNDGKHKAIGEVIILIIKPIYYEFNDIFKHGMISDLNVNDKIDAFLIRMKRVKAYVMDNAVGTLFDNIKEFLQSFVTMLINGIVNAFVGLLKKVLQVITEGFTAIISAVKILIKDKDDAGNPITPAQKADAIVKLLATTAVTFLGAYFEETILSFLNGTPIEFLKDIIMIMLTGIATTIIVWLLDQADIFSVKDEKRTLRVKEIFQLRVQVIKENTDIFEKASIEVLTKQKLQFKKIVSEMNSAIAQNLDINTSVGNMADFMSIELTVKSTNQFLHLLETNKQLNI